MVKARHGLRDWSSWTFLTLDAARDTPQSLSIGAAIRGNATAR